LNGSIAESETAIFFPGPWQEGLKIFIAIRKGRQARIRACASDTVTFVYEESGNLSKAKGIPLDKIKAILRDGGMASMGTPGVDIRGMRGKDSGKWAGGSMESIETAKGTLSVGARLPVGRRFCEVQLRRETQ